MKRIICTLCFSFFSIISFAQIKAVTDKGDEVLLYADGTWKYVKADANSADHIDTSNIIYTKDEKSSFLVKSSKTGFGIYVDPKNWKFSKGDAAASVEYEFSLKEKDTYGLWLVEKIQMPYSTLKEAAISNARDAAPDVKLIKQEYRRVNGSLILMLQMAGTIKGIAFTYLGYYYSSPKGTIQLLTYTSANLFDEYRNEMETFLNGFVGNVPQD